MALGTIPSVLSYLFALLVSGLVIGALGRLAVPGRNPMGIGMTILLGIAGSLIGGFITRALGLGTGLSFVAAVLAAAGLVYLVSSRQRPGLLGGRRRGVLTGGRRRGLLSGSRRGLL
ncbi:MAG TPA: GlsB/YeaQ/YmgE family stress response membrane protein [Acidimicrobiales bacterium]|nr:GlsB/YeaQ/YmgE family stress response membrane protein [Acidimicrobiales bacterium]